MFTKFLSFVDFFHAFLISLNRKFVLWFDGFFVSVARHLDSTPFDAKGEVFGGRACACFHGGMDGSVLRAENETTSIWFPLPFAARVFIVCFDMPDFISFVSYHPFDCILRKIYKYQGISSVWLKSAQTLNRHAWRLLQRHVAEPFEQKVFCRNAGKNHGRHHVLCGTKQCSPERWGLEESCMISWLHHLDP